MMLQIDTGCPVCGNHRCTVQITIGVETKLSIVRCVDCTLEFAYPFQTSDYSESSAITSDGYIERMLNDYTAVQSLLARRASLRIERYRALLGKKPKRMLEIGSGPGWMVKTYLGHGIKVVGLEIDQTLVAASVPGAVVLQGDICTIDPSSLGLFDVIYSSFTTGHFLH